jgi:hypothetical protein
VNTGIVSRSRAIWPFLLLFLLTNLLTATEPEFPLNSDLNQPAKVFAELFQQLPEEISVLPTEHYFYWRSSQKGQPIRGNIRFANNLRSQRIVSFAYSGAGAKQSLWLKAGDGVQVVCETEFRILVSYQQKTVRFLLHELPQTPPTKFQLTADEQFVERTYDESGRQFFLIYHRKENHFTWVLDETKPLSHKLLAADCWLDEPTGFVFFQQGNRSTLAGVSEANIKANTAYDGPFDQLADNYALTSGRKALLEKAVPECAGKIDAWGNYLHEAKPKRVALVPYLAYQTVDEAVDFVKQAKRTEAPLRFIARGGK